MGTLCHIKTVRGYSRCIILRTMANVHTKIQKRQKLLSPRLRKNSPKQEISKSSPRYQKVAKIS